MRFTHRLTLFILSLFIAGPTLRAQDSTAQRYYDIQNITLNRSVLRGTIGNFVPRETAVEKVTISSLNRENIRGLVKNRFVNDKAVIRFRIRNSADTAKSIWFTPGFYSWNINLYRVDSGSSNFQPIAQVMPDNEDGMGYRKITLAPHDSTTIFAELFFAKTYLNRITPVLISDDFLIQYIAARRGSTSNMNLITYIFCGLLLMMILYSLAVFFQGANSEFLYYSAYAFFIALMLFLKTINTFRTTWFSFFQEEYLDFIMQNTGIAFYMLFMQRYLDTKNNHPTLNRLYNAGIVLLVASCLGYTYFHFFSNNFIAENAIENITKISLLAWVVIFLVYSLKNWSDKLLRYLFWGNVCLLLFSLISLLFTLNIPIANWPGVFGNSLFHYEFGLFLELVFFLAALNHKNRRLLIAEARERERLKAENLMKEYEKEIAVYKAQQQERERISADMHDELGAGMTAIRLMSEIARNKMKENTPIEIDKISLSADEVLNKMNAIIWSMNSGNDTVDNLVSYIRAYALEYFESTPVMCKVYTPPTIQPIELTGDKRRNIFLCVKESLNNALKHSKATEIKINFEIGEILQIQIIDNGVGIDLQKLKPFGNGLKNITKRMQIIGGTYAIESKNGTIVTLRLPL